MEIKQFFGNHHDKFIGLALVVGFLKVIDFLPDSLPLFEEYTYWFYMAIFALAGYLYYEYIFGKNYGVHGTTYKKTVAPRNLSHEYSTPSDEMREYQEFKRMKDSSNFPSFEGRK